MEKLWRERSCHASSVEKSSTGSHSLVNMSKRFIVESRTELAHTVLMPHTVASIWNFILQKFTLVPSWVKKFVHIVKNLQLISSITQVYTIPYSHKLKLNKYVLEKIYLFVLNKPLLSPSFYVRLFGLIKSTFELQKQMYINITKCKWFLKFIWIQQEYIFHAINTNHNINLVWIFGTIWTWVGCVLQTLILKCPTTAQFPHS